MKPKKLTSRQQAFVNEYLQCWNASEAARRTGSRGKAAWQQAWRMSRNVEVQAEIRARIQRTAMAADEVLGRLVAQARGLLPTSTQDTPEGEVREFHMLGALTQIGRHLQLFSQRFSTRAPVKALGVEAALELMYGESPNHTEGEE